MFETVTHVSMSCCYGGSGSDKVEAANDAENACRQRDHDSDLDANNWVKFRDANRTGQQGNAPMSHHTGAQLMAFPFQTMVPTK